ncbi:MAG: DinB family protein [Acidobacteriota bacterium]|nr:MAG: DinB family protein [Acidobacteriota bacterium]
MHTLRLVLTLLCFVFIFGMTTGQAVISDDEKMSSEERNKAVNWLKESHRQTLEAIEGLSDEQWNFKSSPERWSVGEVAEHIYLSEGLLFKQVEAALASPVNPNWREKTRGKSEFIERVMVNRQGKAQAPEPIVPSGKISKDDLLAKIKSARAATLKFAEETDAPLKSHTTEHPFPVFNTLSAYNWLIYIPLHNIRHNLQIAEVKAHPDFPKK